MNWKKFLPRSVRERLDVSRWSVTTLMHEVAAQIPPGHLILDAGAGDSRYRSLFEGRDYVGVDAAVGKGLEYSGLDALSDLAALPFPDKELFAAEGNLACDYLITASRGCVFRCRFCCEHVFAARTRAGFHRRRSVQSVIDELLWARERFALRRVRFMDPVLLTDRAWTADLLARYPLYPELDLDYLREAFL